MKYDLSGAAVRPLDCELFDEVFDFVLPGLEAGTVGMLASPGGMGKSFWSLQAACAVAAAGADLLGLNVERHGNVLYLSADDGRKALKSRLHSICLQANDSDAWRLVDERVLPVPVGGMHLNLLKEDTCQSIIETAKGARLIVVDTLRKFHTLDENDSADMTRVLDALDDIARETGAAVVFVHHANKGAATGGRLHEQQAARGSSALSDNSRWAAYLAPMAVEDAERYTDNGRRIDDPRNYVQFGVSKQGYCAPVTPTWYRRGDGGVLQVAHVQKVGGKAATSNSNPKRFGVVRGAL